MLNYYITHEPEWETIENGWHAVVTPGGKSAQWTAYIEDAEIPHWRIWAGCIFNTFDDARRWCIEQMSQQIHRSISSNHDEEEEGYDDAAEMDWVWGELEFMHQSEFMAY